MEKLFVFDRIRLTIPNDHSDFELRGARIDSEFPRVSDNWIKSGNQKKMDGRHKTFKTNNIQKDVKT